MDLEESNDGAIHRAAIIGTGRAVGLTWSSQKVSKRWNRTPLCAPRADRDEIEGHLIDSLTPGEDLRTCFLRR